MHGIHLQQIKEIMDGVAFGFTVVVYGMAVPYFFGLKLYRRLKFLKKLFLLAFIISGLYTAAKIINLIKTY